MKNKKLMEEMLNHPYIFHKEFENLLLFCYTRACVYDSKWDEYTMRARGIIFDRDTGEIVSVPFIKFKNASELQGEVDLHKLSEKPFIALKKLDGSLAIHFRHGSQDYIATKGSFFSDQAQWATKWFREHIKSNEMLKGHTYLFEMIYPENKIVVDYGNTEELILIGVINNDTSKEIPYTSLKEEGKRIGATIAEAVEFTSLDEIYNYCMTLPANEEGFVVTFHNGLKVKFKGSAYCKIHRQLAHMTPLAFWAAWDLDAADIPKDYLSGLPEEFRELTDLLCDQVRDIHYRPYNEIKEAYYDLMKDYPAGINEREVFFKAKDKYPELSGEITRFHKKRYHKIWWEIHKRVRPHFNVLPESVAGVDRLKRILEEN